MWSGIWFPFLKTNWRDLKVFKVHLLAFQCCLKWIKMINIFNHVFLVVPFCWHDAKYIWEQEKLCFNKRSHLSITSSFLSGCQDKVNDDGSVPYELVKKPAVTWALKIKQILTCRSWKGSRVPLDKSFFGLT